MLQLAVGAVGDLGQYPTTALQEYEPDVNNVDPLSMHLLFTISKIMPAYSSKEYKRLLWTPDSQTAEYGLFDDPQVCT